MAALKKGVFSQHSLELREWQTFTVVEERRLHLNTQQTDVAFALVLGAQM